MQEYRDDDLVSSIELPEDAQTLTEKLAESLKKMSNGEIDYVRIGRFPEENEAIEVNGLRFLVTQSREGQFTADINDPRLLNKDKTD